MKRGINKILTLRDDKRILRSLMAELLPIAQNPENNSKKIEKWKKHIRLEGDKPMVFVFPDGAMPEILPYDSLQCTNPAARNVEYELRHRLLRHRYIKDDVPITAEVDVQKAITNTMWGVEPQRKLLPGRSAFGMVSIIDSPSDWKKLSMPVVTHNEQQSAADYAFIQDAIGDMTKVHLAGQKKFSFHLMYWYCDYRGLENMLYDLYEESEMIHDVILFFTEGVKSMMRSMKENCWNPSV